MVRPLLLKSSKTTSLNGHAPVPGDKSISHRSLMLGSIAIGETIISGLLEGEDVICTAEAMNKMGAKIYKSDDGLWHVFGVSLGGLEEPDSFLDMGNSGTSTRLLMGLLSTHPITTFFSGDASLTKRPMKRVITPLEQMGASFASREGGKLPLTVIGTDDPLPIEYHLPVASAQVKSAILLAGLNTKGTTSVIEDRATRDHTEKMLQHFGVDVCVEILKDGAKKISVTGHKELHGCSIDVPADPSSAAFPTVAALINEGSDITINNVCMNPTRTGLYETLKEMGASIIFKNERIQAGEPVADLRIIGDSPLKGIDVPADRVPSMIDEFPVLAVAAACAKGTTRMTGLAELRVKESDRLAMVAKGLKACGVELEEGEESLTIFGQGKPPKGGAMIETALDHRIAMSFLVLGTSTDHHIEVDDANPIKTSFPNFIDMMNDLGAHLEEIDFTNFED